MSEEEQKVKQGKVVKEGEAGDLVKDTLESARDISPEEIEEFKKEVKENPQGAVNPPEDLKEKIKEDVSKKAAKDIRVGVAGPPKEVKRIAEKFGPQSETTVIARELEQKEDLPDPLENQLDKMKDTETDPPHQDVLDFKKEAVEFLNQDEVESEVIESISYRGDKQGLRIETDFDTEIRNSNRFEEVQHSVRDITVEDFDIEDGDLEEEFEEDWINKDNLEDFYDEAVTNGPFDADEYDLEDMLPAFVYREDMIDDEEWEDAKEKLPETLEEIREGNWPPPGQDSPLRIIESAVRSIEKDLDDEDKDQLEKAFMDGVEKEFPGSVSENGETLDPDEWVKKRQDPDVEKPYDHVDDIFLEFENLEESDLEESDREEIIEKTQKVFEEVRKAEEKGVKGIGEVSGTIKETFDSSEDGSTFMGAKLDREERPTYDTIEKAQEEIEESVEKEPVAPGDDVPDSVFMEDEMNKESSTDSGSDSPYKLESDNITMDVETEKDGLIRVLNEFIQNNDLDMDVPSGFKLDDIRIKGGKIKFHFVQGEIESEQSPEREAEEMSRIWDAPSKEDIKRLEDSINMTLTVEIDEPE